MAGLLAFCPAALGQQSDQTGPEAGASIAAPPAPEQEQTSEPNRLSGDNDQADAPQTLQQGPIHEAFAAPIGSSGGVAEGEMSKPIEQEPPEPINELPPAEKPEGDNVKWIPGYWMWSADQYDFVWVSGVWRNTPPGRRWTPGSWIEVDGKYAWSAGFWVDAQATQVNYLPAPPESLEQGPSSPSPSDQHFWVPGCWVYQNNDYQWRTGYWYQGQQDWVWVPSYYNQTPRGYVYINGYWDRPLARRGVLYAPVFWSGNAYRQPGFAYRPRSVVDTGLLITSLFVNPGRGHYYYGSYGPQYRNQGYYPWFGYANAGPRRYDPLFSYYRWNNGVPGGRGFGDLQRDYQRFDDPNFDRGNRGRQDGAGLAAGLIAASYNDLPEQDRGFRMRDLDERSRRDAIDRTDRFNAFQQQRRALDRDASAGGQAVLDDLTGRNRNRGENRGGEATNAADAAIDQLSQGRGARASQGAQNQRVLRLPLDQTADTQGGDARAANNGQQAAESAGRQGRSDAQQAADRARQSADQARQNAQQNAQTAIDRARQRAGLQQPAATQQPGANQRPGVQQPAAQGSPLQQPFQQNGRNFGRPQQPTGQPGGQQRGAAPQQLQQPGATRGFNPQAGGNRSFSVPNRPSPGVQPQTPRGNPGAAPNRGPQINRGGGQGAPGGGQPALGNSLGGSRRGGK